MSDSIIIDWDKPVEAVDGNGTVWPLQHVAVRSNGVSIKLPLGFASVDGGSIEDQTWEWDKDGTSNKWLPTIRNVAPKEVEWGPEIKVEGKRPEWLRTGDQWQWKLDDCEWITANHQPEDYAWLITDMDAIRLPADHPHYATPTRTALEQRMEDLVRRMVDEDPALYWRDMRAEARAILAELEPVDPILLEARQVVADQYGNNVPHLREQALSGAGDEWFHTKVAIAALSRGRALERGESPVTNEGAGR